MRRASEPWDAMTNLARSFELVPGLARTGERASKLFQPFVRKHPAALQIADEFGRENSAGPPEALVQAWREALRQEFGAVAPPPPGDFEQWSCPSRSHRSMRG